MADIKKVISPIPKQKFFDSDGKPLVGGKVFTYAAGTTTKAVTYTDASGLTQNTNPVILDERGEADIWFPPLAPIAADAVPPGPPGPPGPQGPPGGGALQAASITITAAELSVIDGTNLAKTLLEGQGEGTVIIPIAVAWKGIYNTTPFTNTTGLNLAYSNDVGDFDYSNYPNISANSGVSPSLDLLKQTDNDYDFTTLQVNYTGTGLATDADQATTYALFSAVENTGIVVWWNADSFDTDGDSDVTVTMWYVLLTATTPIPTTIVTSVVNNDGTLTISPTTGDVIASWNFSQFKNVNAKGQFLLQNTNGGVGAYGAITVASDTGESKGLSLLAASSAYTGGNLIGASQNALFDNSNGLVIVQNQSGPVTIATGGNLSGNERVTILGANGSGSKAGNIGIGSGMTNPTARLDIKAGSAASGTAPIKLHSGALLTTPEAGALETLGDKLYFTVPTGPTRKEIPLGASNSAIEIAIESYTSTVGVTLNWGTYSFGSHPVPLTQFIYDPDSLIALGFDVFNGRLVFNRTCLMTMSCTLHGQRADALPSLVTLALSHTGGTELFGNSAYNPVTDLGVEITCNVTTGPFQVVAGDQWDGNFVLAADNTVFSRVTIKQLTLQAQILALLD